MNELAKAMEAGPILGRDTYAGVGEIVKVESLEAFGQPKKAKLKVGQPVWLKRLNVQSSQLKMTSISSIGNKWFYVTDEAYGRYNIETMFHDGGRYSSSYRAYASLQEVSDEIELKRLESLIKGKIIYHSGYRMSFDQVKKIAAILNIE